MLLRGILVSFDSGTWTAVVRLDSSVPQALTGVAVSRALASGEMVADRRVLLAPGDHGDVADIVVIAVW